MPLEIDGLMWPSGDDPCGEVKKERDALRARVEMSLCQLEQTTVQWLADKVERDALRIRVEELRKEVGKLAQRDGWATERIKQLEEALMWYADEWNYFSNTGDGIPTDNDGGKRARAALGEEGK